MVFNFMQARARPTIPPAVRRVQGAVSLAELAPGSVAVVESVDDSGPIGRRLLDLGFLPRTLVRVLRRAPLGDPVVFELRGTMLCLRRSEASRVRVQPA
jgi:ferrous iron transport protein A